MNYFIYIYNLFKCDHIFQTVDIPIFQRYRKREGLIRSENGDSKVEIKMMDIRDLIEYKCLWKILRKNGYFRRA